MYNLEEIQKRVKQSVCAKRYIHCVGVMNEAVKLAEHYGADVEKARIAGMAHDITKDFDIEQGFNMCEMLGVELDDVSRFEKKLIHAPLGAMYVKKMLQIEDEDIYDAIRYHTTAKRNMSLLTKIVYIADYIEPNREYFNGLTELRELAYTNLDAAIRLGLEMTIKSLIEKGRMIHPNTVEARNYLIK